MKYKGIVSLIFCVSLTTTVLAQSGDEEIGGVGTPNFMVKFLSAHKIGNSTIFLMSEGQCGHRYNHVGQHAANC